MKFNTRTSCTKDEAILIMLEFPILPTLLPDDYEDTSQIPFHEVLESMRDNLLIEMRDDGYSEYQVKKELDEFDEIFSIPPVVRVLQ